MLPINKIILDHEDFVKIKLYQACMLLKADSSSWLKIRSNLSAKYKFTLDLDTFSETLGAGIRVLPSRSAIWQKNSSVVELFVRYDFEHEQDAAVREMLVQGLTERNRIETNPSLTNLYTSHRFASRSSSDLLGVIRLELKHIPIEVIEHLITTWENILANVYQQKLSYDSYHSFLEKQ
jgi:hypothetical protein